MRVLVVEDPALARLLQDNLIEVTHVRPEQAVAYLRGGSFHTVVLRFESLWVLRKVHEARIAVFVVVLAEHDSVDAELSAFAAGADDYVRAGAPPHVVLVRIQILGRYTPGDHDADSALKKERPNLVVRDKVVLDVDRYTCKVNGRDIHLTHREHKILAFLMRRVGQDVSRNQIIEHAWGANEDVGEQSLSTYIKRTRRKLENADPAHTYIQTAYAIGYRFEKRSVR